MSLAAVVAAGLPGDRHPVTIDGWLEKQQRLARELRDAGHPLAALAQQVLEDAAYLIRTHAGQPCERWNGEAYLPGAPA